MKWHVSCRSIVMRHANQCTMQQSMLARQQQRLPHMYLQHFLTACCMMELRLVTGTAQGLMHCEDGKTHLCMLQAHKCSAWTRFAVGAPSAQERSLAATARDSRPRLSWPTPNTRHDIFPSDPSWAALLSDRHGTCIWHRAGAQQVCHTGCGGPQDLSINLAAGGVLKHPATRDPARRMSQTGCTLMAVCLVRAYFSPAVGCPFWVCDGVVHCCAGYKFCQDCKEACSIGTAAPWHQVPCLIRQCRLKKSKSSFICASTALDKHTCWLTGKGTCLCQTDDMLHIHCASVYAALQRLYSGTIAMQDVLITSSCK